MQEINITLNNLDNQKWKKQILNNLKQDILGELKTSNIKTANINIYTISRKQDLVSIKEDKDIINIVLTTSVDPKFLMEALIRVDDVCNINNEISFLSKRIIRVLKQSTKKLTEPLDSRIVHEINKRR